MSADDRRIGPEGNHPLRGVDGIQPAARALYLPQGRRVRFGAGVGHVSRLLAADGSRTATGIKLWRVTDRRGSPEQTWNPTLARVLSVAHANEFAERCVR